MVAAIHFGEPVEIEEDKQTINPDMEDSYADKTYPRFAFELIHKTNAITPVTTVSLVYLHVGT
jgi:putative phosphoserine phosphatase/1-acylglycerol-3-phosphate O-acyltransferase